MTRRGWFRALVFFMAQALSLMFLRGAAAQDEVASLRQTLRSYLKCRRQLEFDFIDLVVAKVNQGQLPVAMVLSMMKWARERREDIPFMYFQEGIRRRAAEIGVTL